MNAIIRSVLFQFLIAGLAGGLYAQTTQGNTNIPDSMPLPMPTYGWNLGNTLEATWGVPNWTAAPFYTAANAGFNAVRIPCAWDFNSTTNISGGVTNYLINPAFMAQVKQAVDDAIAAGMYVVINDHWDDGWLENNIGTTVDPIINAKMKSYWTQIATTFAGYDNHLLFAAANEPNVNNPAEDGHVDGLLSDVRQRGSRRRRQQHQSLAGAAKRSGHDVVECPADGHGFQPSDGRISSATRLLCSRSFIPINRGATAIYFWGPAYHYSGDPTRNATWGEEGAIDSGFQQLTDLYVSKGIPVMIGEFGAAGRRPSDRNGGSLESCFHALLEQVCR